MQLHDSTDLLLQKDLDEQDMLGWDQFLLGQEDNERNCRIKSSQGWQPSYPKT